MVASSQSWSRPAERQHTALALGAALVLMIGSWAVLHGWFFARSQIVDTPVYYRYGNAVAEGRVPYRDFGVEYPPGALPIFAAPAVGHAPVSFDSYRRIFETLLWIGSAIGLLCMASVLRSVRAEPRRAAAALLLAAALPVALGSVCLSRFDAWPAALAVGGLAALVAGRHRLGLGVLGWGLATKLWPGVLVPFALVYVWRREGRREALLAGAAFLAVAAAFFVPFLVVAPGGVWDSLVRQLTRPLQIESLGSAFLLAAHHTFGLGLEMKSSHGSQNLAGGLPAGIGIGLTVLQIGALLALWLRWLRGPAPTREELVRHSAAAVTAFVALGKVLSPQFLIWLIPLVPLVRGRRGLAASALLLVACVLTQLWFPFRYWPLALRFDEPASWLVLVRDLVLLALLAVLSWPARRRAASPS